MQACMRVGLAAVLSQCNSMSEAPRERLMQSLHRYLLRRGKGRRVPWRSLLGGVGKPRWVRGRGEERRGGGEATFVQGAVAELGTTYVAFGRGLWSFELWRVLAWPQHTQLRAHL
ncbi:hypothetical protein GW17_00060793 [Ensete ventricosum]|nr:hypothetical protein GW17_00060793 [Ensete ventricosum]